MTTSTPSPVTLAEIAAACAGACTTGDPATPVVGLFQDSRRVTPGSLFAARSGQQRDGKAFVADAIARGAAALLTDDPALAAASTLPAIVVPDVRAALPFAAARAYHEPFARLRVVGVTGTNGKTTTTQLIGQVLASAGLAPGVLGTLGLRFEGTEIGGAHTTPEADELARLAHLLVQRGATHLVMEVSSHALALGRVEAVPFAVAAFTNLSQDHLDLHGTMHAYGEAKARLFTALSPGASVINVDDAFGRDLARRATSPSVLRYSALADGADIVARGARIDASGIEARVCTPSGERVLRSALTGAHNLENLLLVIGVALSLGLTLDQIVEALASTSEVPGRLERCSGPGDDLLVLVDYAHTPDALARALAAARPLSRGKLWCVFGCGGDRDPTKRGPMGAIAARGADRVIVTNDNPRSERPEDIAAAIVAGVQGEGGRCDVELDRAKAIGLAIAGAAPGDVVLVAGKGHETYQIMGPVTRHFDDREEARARLSERRARG